MTRINFRLQRRYNNNLPLSALGLPYLGEAGAHEDVPYVVHVSFLEPRLLGRLGQVRVAGPPAVLARDQFVRVVVAPGAWSRQRHQ